MRKKTGSAITILLFFTIITSGCMDIITDITNGSTRYESTPVEISYTILYGYNVECTGAGKYEINYECDLPDNYLGTPTYSLLYNREYENKQLAGNTVVHWELNDRDDHQYRLGISSNVHSQNYILSDLNGKNTLSVEDIKANHSDIFLQYIRPQSNDTITFIDPDNPTIKNIAKNIQNQAKTTNSFVLAKELFKWLKKETSYQTHFGYDGVQPASLTCNLKTGDCDDLSFLYVSLCRSLGIPARFIRGYLVDEGSTIPETAVAHAWVEVFVGPNIGSNGWISIECASPSKNLEIQVHQNFGAEDSHHLRLFVDDGSNESMNASMSGISWIIYGSDIEVEATAFVEIKNYKLLDSKNLVITNENKRSYE